jgi:hypothetical protein
VDKLYDSTLSVPYLGTTRYTQYAAGFSFDSYIVPPDFDADLDTDLVLGTHLYCPMNQEAKRELEDAEGKPPEWSKVNVDSSFAVLQPHDHIDPSQAGPTQVLLVSSLADSTNPTLATPFESQRLVVIRPTPSDAPSPLTLPVNAPATPESLSDLTTLPHLHSPSLISSLSYVRERSESKEELAAAARQPPTPASARAERAPTTDASNGTSRTGGTSGRARQRPTPTTARGERAE